MINGNHATLHEDGPVEQRERRLRPQRWRQHYTRTVRDAALEIGLKKSGDRF